MAHNTNNAYCHPSRNGPIKMSDSKPVTAGIKVQNNAAINWAVHSILPRHPVIASNMIQESLDVSGLLR